MSKENEQVFMAEISNLLYPEGLCNVKEKLVFEVCYFPDNLSLSTKELAEYLENRHPEVISDFITTTRVVQLRSNVAKKLAKQFESEMLADEIPLEYIEDVEKGGVARKKSPFRIAANWLWNYQYPRWLVDRALDSLIANGTQNLDWIAFNPVESEEKRIKGNSRPKPLQPFIPLNKNSYISIKLAKSEGYFLLLNRSFATASRLILCPSVGIAPNPQVSGEEILMPQEDAELQNVYFDKKGKEEFIGIFVNKSFDLDWLKPNQEESIPICTPERINGLLSKLKETEYQVYYQSFEVK